MKTIGLGLFPAAGGEVLINQLTSDRHDPEAKIPELKRCAVRIEKEA